MINPVDLTVLDPERSRPFYEAAGGQEAVAPPPRRPMNGSPAAPLRRAAEQSLRRRFHRGGDID
jgi:hypothetical protein